jgi:hypothetical protein
VSVPVLRYVLAVKPTVKFGTAFFQKADYLLSRFATSPASLAWEKVPFSFVVDWFVDLRGVLSTLDSLVGFNPYETVSLTKSVKYELATDTFVETFSPCTGGLLQSFSSGTFEYKHYDRSNISPGQMPRWNPRFGKNQAGITAALISQKLTSFLRAKGIKVVLE